MTPFRRILCPVDFSEVSRRALDQALGLAKASGASLTVLHVVSPVPYTDPIMAPALVFTPEDLERVHDELVSFTKEAGGETADVMIVQHGLPASAIVEEAGETRADLIVMGTHGRSGIRRLMIGSVTETVLRKATCPVLTVPPRAPDVVPLGLDSFRRILCGVDFSPSSLKALAYAASLAREAHAPLTVMHIAEPTRLSEFALAGAADHVPAAERCELQQRLHAVVPADEHVTQVIGEGSAFRELLRRAADDHSDLIVLGAHGGPAVAVGFGSTTTHVIRESTCPVLTVRA